MLRGNSKTFEINFGCESTTMRKSWRALAQKVLAPTYFASVISARMRTLRFKNPEACEELGIKIRSDFRRFP